MLYLFKWKLIDLMIFCFIQDKMCVLENSGESLVLSKDVLNGRMYLYIKFQLKCFFKLSWNISVKVIFSFQKLKISFSEIPFQKRPPHAQLIRSVIKRQTTQTTSDYEWLQVTTSQTTSDYMWLRVTTSQTMINISQLWMKRIFTS